MTPAPLVSPAAVDPQNPWLGLASFTEETRAYFHGRDEEVAELGRRVQRKLLTILFGQSGLGKTSILRAGLVPRLRPEGYCPVYVRLDYGRESRRPPSKSNRPSCARPRPPETGRSPASPKPARRSGNFSTTATMCCATTLAAR